ncbi:hypothetical protein MRX96_028962 [Rhipicephalus microplus]
MAEGTTPSNAKLPGELNLASVEGDVDESHRLHDLARGRAETRERLLQSQRKTTVRYDKKRRTPRFITGDLVLLELSARGTLDPRYEAKQVPNYQHEQQIKVMQPFSFVNYQPESRQVAPSFVCEQFSEQQ